MKKYIILAVFLSAIVLSGCNKTNKELSGDVPPEVIIEIDGETYVTILGSYCWGPDSSGTAICADTAGPVELLEDKEPIQVQVGEKVTVIMDYKPKPNEIHLSQIMNDKRTEIELNNNQFMAPDEKGTYFYAYSVWWMDEEDENLSHGDAFYAFVLEVK
ncbi:hypothetical protein QTL97_15620 [Sporosarcina thermotolerans]|uniref:Lipoprotein n=1 Tax=Sporosarcina thermotolerans TaxID=633404 RepID=A0AAW9AE29_9BACL|nr:hypothetical protein [Sporosarcina thermotolerans]MDW0118360.1 hypothetical protein [Sporosarcina thermotolerans]WHT49414.1 hypothetical protein QNH10_07705 [Sporosarcina thermotolerans]